MLSKKLSEEEREDFVIGFLFVQFKKWFNNENSLIYGIDKNLKISEILDFEIINSGETIKELIKCAARDVNSMLDLDEIENDDYDFNEEVQKYENNEYYEIFKFFSPLTVREVMSYRTA